MRVNRYQPKQVAENVTLQELPANDVIGDCNLSDPNLPKPDFRGT